MISVLCPDCDHEFVAVGLLTDDGVYTCSNCKGTITVTLEFEPAEEEKEADA